MIARIGKYVIIRTSIEVLVLLVFLSVSWFGYGVYWSGQLQGQYERCVQTDTWGDDLWGLVNDYRTEKGLTPFVEDAKLCKLAIIRSYEAQESWGHYGPNSICVDSTRVKYCPDCKFMGENLAKDYSSPKGAIDGWIRSPAHKEILEGGYTQGCIGVSRDEKGNIYTALIVGKK